MLRLLGFVLALMVLAACVTWQTSLWSLTMALGALGLTLPLPSGGRRRVTRLLGLALLVGPPVVRLLWLSSGLPQADLTVWPEGAPSRLVDRLLPERDGALLAAGLLSTFQPLPDDEGSRLHAVLHAAYEAMDGLDARLATPTIATYAGLQTDHAFDVVRFSPHAAREDAAVVFLHGYAGNFLVYCWELAQAAASARLHTYCPSLGPQADWWSARGERTLRRTLARLKENGVKRVYLAGLSNGAAGASALAHRFEGELAGLILISGMRGRPTTLPTLVIQGARDRMMPSRLARAYSAGRPHIRYHELDGGHLIFLSQSARVRPVIASFLQALGNDR